MFDSSITRAGAGSGKEAHMTNHIGQQIGNYRLVHLLGRGGFADTYLGDHLYLGTQAAIKIYQAQLAQTDQGRFYSEVAIIAGLKHPNILRVLEYAVDGNTPYLVIEYAPSGNLRQRHLKGIPLSPAVIVPYLKQVAAALQHAHNQMLVHGDLKPENMLVGANNEILLGDFGIAVIAQAVAGTITYMAPEQIRGNPRPASDQYALGVVIYEWLCGLPPFTGMDREVALQHERTQPPSLRERVPGISPDVEQVVLTALTKDPQRRFASIQAFANAFALANQMPGTANGVQGPYSLSPYPESQPAYVSPPPVPAGLQEAFPASATPPGQEDPYTPSTPYVAPQTGTQPSSTPTGPQGQKKARRLSIGILILLIAVVVLIAGSGLIYYTAVYRPNQLHAQATATAVAQVTGTAHANATSTAQTINATSTAVAQVTAQAQATQTALQSIYTQATSGNPNLNDPLSAQDSFGWDEINYTPSGDCAFNGGAYHSSSPAAYFVICYAENSNFSNFAYQVQLTITKGHFGGIAFHGNSANFTAYLFRIGTDGSYLLEKIAQSGNQTNHTTLTSGTSPVITTGNNQPNLVAVVVQGNKIYLYVNKQYVDSASDSTYQSGQIGVYSEGDTAGGSGSEAVFSHLQVWKL